MILSYFTRKKPCDQRVQASQPGFLIIELLQGVLILGVLLLLVTSFHVISTRWQQQAVVRFEVLDALTSHLSGVQIAQQGNTSTSLSVILKKHSQNIPELSALIGVPLQVEQRIAIAEWSDQQGIKHTLRISS